MFLGCCLCVGCVCMCCGCVVAVVVDDVVVGAYKNITQQSNKYINRHICQVNRCCLRSTVVCVRIAVVCAVCCLCCCSLLILFWLL